MPRVKWSFLLPPRDHSFIKWFSAYSYAWLTPHGMTLVAALFVSAGIASPGLHISAYLLTSIILSVLLTAFCAALFFIPSVEAHRKLPSPPQAGEHCIYQVVVKNTSQKPLFDIYVTEGTLPYGLYYAFDHPAFKNYIPYLKPGASETVSLVIHSLKRGIYNLQPLLVGSSYPFNILRCPLKCGHSDKFIVYPFYVSQTQFEIPLQSVFQPGGTVISNNIGDSNEFFGTREYRHRDRLKDIHWPSFAHTGKLIVKEYIDEYYVRTGIVLDTELVQKSHARNLEQRISVTAGIADALAQKGYLIDLLAAGDTFHEFQKGNPLTYLDKMLHILSSMESKSAIDFNSLEAGLMQQIHTLSSLILILQDWDTPRANLCRSLKNLGVNMRIIIVTDRPFSQPPDLEVTIVSDQDKEGLIQ